MRSLSHDAAVVLVHAFVTSRIDHSFTVLVGFPLGLIGRLDLVLRSAARLIGHISKYASVSAYMRHSFIHSDHFYSASSSPLRSAPTRILCRSFKPKRHRQL